MASSTDSRTWATYAEVVGSSCGVGVGYVLAEGDGIVCVDLDHCIVDGVLAGWARAILDQVPPTFVEVSRSGTGLHVWGRGFMGRGVRVREGEVAIEVYGQGRFIAMGTRYGGAPLVLADLSGLEIHY